MKGFYQRGIFAALLVCTIFLAGCGDKLSPGSENDAGTGQQDNTSNLAAERSLSTEGNSTQNTAENGSGIKDNNTADGTSENTGSQTDPGNVPTVPPVVKALYLTGWTAGSKSRVEHYIELAKNTEINSYVIDIKDDDGYVGYESQVPEVRANGAWKKKYDADSVIKSFKENNVHLIGRVVCFKDPIYSIKRPDLAIKNNSGGIWKDKDKISWLNPYNKETWDYHISIAKEALEKGFDEIQFDYVRFPSQSKKNPMNFSGTEKEKYEAINEFLKYASEQLPNVTLSADVFGIILESPADTEKIGQYLELVGKDVNYISPMVYPSHYAAGQVVNNIIFPAPDLKPYEVVYNSLIKAKDRISKTSGYKAKVRPYLQDFTATWIRPKSNYQDYGAKQVREQIKAVYDAGYEEWILWDAGNTYHEDALLKE